ncbi:hypothetical protein BHE74_00028604 [Ensete ventricosum]|nr:hypothetical protein BHE74_00028604 [Ensete ventricosum]RZR82938.1 hypothetical protein BHM03_00009461 [Ensete ventricosum]
MANDQEMSGWTDLLHSSTKLLEHAGPSVHFPSLQVRPHSPVCSFSPFIHSVLSRLLAREGINAERLARDLKSFELKVGTQDDHNLHSDDQLGQKASVAYCTYGIQEALCLMKKQNSNMLAGATTFEDVFPSEATTVEEYLQQVSFSFL